MDVPCLYTELSRWVNHSSRPNKTTGCVLFSPSRLYNELHEGTILTNNSHRHRVSAYVATSPSHHCEYASVTSHEAQSRTYIGSLSPSPPSLPTAIHSTCNQSHTTIGPVPASSAPLSTTMRRHILNSHTTTGSI